MPKRRDLDTLLRDWVYRPDEVLARIIKGSDGRQIVQFSFLDTVLPQHIFIPFHIASSLIVVRV